MQTVDPKYDVEDCSESIDALLLVCSWFIVDAHISMSIKLKHPTIAIVRTAAVRRRMLMSLKRLLIRTIESEKYCKQWGWKNYIFRIDWKDRETETERERERESNNTYHWKTFSNWDPYNGRYYYNRCKCDQKMYEWASKQDGRINAGHNLNNQCGYQRQWWHRFSLLCVFGF